MSKATQVFTCIFTNTPPNGGGGAYNVDTLPAQERNMYNAVSNAYQQIVAVSGDQPLVLAICNAKEAQYQSYLSTVSLSPPFVAMIATYPDGSKKTYTTKSLDVKNRVQALLAGEFGGTGIPTNAGEGEGGWGQGNALVCQLIPPLCALGFLPWLALAAVTTYKAAESRSTTGRIMWGIPAALFVVGFFERGGMKQIQWWTKKAGIGSVPYFKHNGKELVILHTIRYDTGKRTNLEKEMKEKGIIATHWLTTKQSGTPKYLVNEFSNGSFGSIKSWK